MDEIIQIRLTKHSGKEEVSLFSVELFCMISTLDDTQDNVLLVRDPVPFSNMLHGLTYG